jgi:hypothetical protein
METLQAAIVIAEQERDQAVAARTVAEAQAAQVLVDLSTAQAAAAATAAAAALTSAAAGAGKATTPLDIMFDGDSGALRLFLSKVQQRAIQFGWTSILQIKQAGTTFNFIEKYGQVTMASIKVRAIAIEAANDRETQNSSQMHTFLISSITDGLLGKVISQKEQYRTDTGFQDGPSLLKVIVTISYVDMRAQAGHIRQCLARLSPTILTPEYNCNIQKLNEYMVVLEEGLAARGEASQDTMMNVQSANMHVRTLILSGMLKTSMLVGSRELR